MVTLVRFFVCSAAFALAGCGARTALETEPRDAGPPAVPEICNRIDDDGDGIVDEGIAPIRCGIGACTQEVSGCVLGGPGECTPRDPSPEICNGVDDDCDGPIDEDLGFGAVAPRIVVRSDEGTTGACSSCQWAAGAQLWRTDEGLLAVWRMGFDGSRPLPNAYARQLDSDGRALAEPFVLFDTNVPNGFRLAPISRSRAMLGFCGRLGDDTMASALLDPGGAIDIVERSPAGFGCGAHHPDVAWSGERALFSWTNNRGLDRAVLLDVTDETGTSLEARELLSSEGDLSVPSRFAVGHGAVAMVTGFSPEPRITRLRFYLFDALGDERFQTDLDSPPESRWANTSVAPSTDGWLIVGTDRTSFDEPTGRTLVRLAVDGAIVEGPTLVEPGYEWQRVELEALSGGGFVLGGLLEDPEGVSGIAVMRLDEMGRGGLVWRPEPLEYFGLSGFDLVEDEGRIWLIYVGPAEDDEPNEVVLWQLGCVPL